LAGLLRWRKMKVTVVEVGQFLQLGLVQNRDMATVKF
jgi:hypothetical protein